VLIKTIEMKFKNNSIGNSRKLLPSQPWPQNSRRPCQRRSGALAAKIIKKNSPLKYDANYEHHRKFAAHLAMNDAATVTSKNYAAPSLLRCGQRLPAAAGLSDDRAQIVTEGLLEGDLLGHTTHGFALLPAYLQALQKKKRWRIAWLASFFCLNAIVFLQNAQATPTVTAPAVIVQSDSQSFQQNLAAHELRRYLFLRTGAWLEITNHPVKGQSNILLARRDSPELPQALRHATSTLGPEEYLIKSTGRSGARQLFIIGGDDTGVLYGAYRLLEHFGIRFYLSGDVIPDGQIAFAIPALDDHGQPLFKLRGIQPFHDFPEGPDWWNPDDYLAYIGQLPKMRMNFIGLHTYPENGPHAEPTVWIGPPDEIGQGSEVRASYPSFYASTARNGYWGYAAMPTGDFVAGAANLFATDEFGPAVQAGCLPVGTNMAQDNLVFARTADMLRRAFTEAHALGIKTVVGTETPLTIPAALKKRLEAQGKNPTNPAVVRELYRGIFQRIAQSYPIDYYWLWTPEDWTWHGAKPAAIAATKADLQLAVDALKEIGSPFQLATCGWVIGPPGNALGFDRLLPAGAPISCINRQTGHSGIDAAFAEITDRPKWMIPWIENDPDLTMPQLWVGRMRQDAVDARRLGGEDLIGILWRTKVTAMNVAALADAAWNQSWINLRSLPPLATNGPVSQDNRKAPCVDFYVDWATSSFGPAAGRPVGELFARVDGTDFPAPANWVDGPGGILTNKPAWSQEQAHYTFVAELAKLRGLVTSPGDRDRFDYWLNTFRYLRTAAEIGSTAGELARQVAALNQTTNASARAELASAAVALRVQLSRLWEMMLTEQLAAADTPGELGTIANLEQHNRVFSHLLDHADAALTNALGHALPDTVQLLRDYAGPARLFVPTERTQIARNEMLHIEAIALSAQPVNSVMIHVRPLGSQQDFIAMPLQHLGRGVYEITLPAAREDFEYWIEGRMENGPTLQWPATAPDLNQTVVVVGGYSGNN